MKIYKLEVIRSANRYHIHFTWDCNWGHIIYAENEKQARELAGNNCMGEGTKVWLDSNITSCEELIPTGNNPKIILTDFRAG